MKSPAKKRTTGVPPARLRASEYGRNAVDMAKFLLGTILCRRLDDGTVLRARIVETEAYFGEKDTACHAHRGRTPRTDVMYAPGGFAYVYLCYGMHAMLNVVSGPVGHPEAVLVRGVEGAVGPGRLTKALGVTCALNRENLVESERLWIESDGAPPRFDASPRIGIGYASKRDRERKWRFSVRSSAAPSGILRFATLRTMPEREEDAAAWFHEKWGVPEAAYLECMDAFLSGRTEYGWYLCLDGDRIVGGLGVIENDFHDRKDLSPNLCAVYVDETHRRRGIAGRLLGMAVEDLRGKGVSPVYLLTDHTGFYERYGWEFLCTAMGDGEIEPSRIYMHR